MNPFKKLIFAPIFLILITASIYFYKLILDKYLDVYLGPFAGLYEFSFLAIALFFASLIYCLFVTFTQDIKYALTLALISTLTPFALLSFNLGLVVGFGIFISLIVTYYNLQTNLRSYITFKASTILKGSINLLNTFILITLAFGYYLHTNSIIQTQGFKVPDPIVEWAIDVSLRMQGMSFKGERYTLAQALTPEQLELLKQNPEVLKQFNIETTELEELDANKPQTNAPKNEDTVLPPGLSIKEVAKAQINAMLDSLIKPYLFVIPIILAVAFYGLPSLILWILSKFLGLLLTSIFYVFEKSGFVKYEKEMREVKKIVI